LTPSESKGKRRAFLNNCSAAGSAPFQRRGIGKSKEIASPAFLCRAELIVPKKKIKQSFPQSGQFFESMPMPGIGDRQIQELESPEKSPLTVLRIPFVAPVQGSLDLAPDIGQLEHQGKTVPSARRQRRMLNVAHFISSATTSTIFSRILWSSTPRERFPCEGRILMTESNSIRSGPSSSG